MISPHLIRRIIIVVVIGALGFIVGYVSVHLYKQAHLDPLQQQQAPKFGS